MAFQVKKAVTSSILCLVAIYKVRPSKLITNKLIELL